MEEQIETTYITNTLTYLHLLPKDEQLNELNKILAYFKKKTRKYNKGIDYSPEYEKSLKRVVYLTFKNISKYWLYTTPLFNKYTECKSIQAK